MIQFARLAPPYSIVFIEDIRGGKLPEWERGSRIEATDSCIAIGTYCEIDGDTHFQLGRRGEVDPRAPPTFQGRLKTPSRKIVLRSVPNDPVSDGIVLEMPVMQAEAMISIWTNHPDFPDGIIIGVE